jgi:hypothetical protein
MENLVARQWRYKQLHMIGLQLSKSWVPDDFLLYCSIIAKMSLRQAYTNCSSRHCISRGQLVQALAWGDYQRSMVLKRFQDPMRINLGCTCTVALVATQCSHSNSVTFGNLSRKLCSNFALGGEIIEWMYACKAMKSIVYQTLDRRIGLGAPVVPHISSVSTVNQ